MQDIIITYLSQYPTTAAALSIIGVLRVIMKPLFSLLKLAAKETKTKRDDQFLEKIEHSESYRMLCYILDWFGSVKVGPQK